jgi:hypothetical protein
MEYVYLLREDDTMYKICKTESLSYIVDNELDITIVMCVKDSTIIETLLYAIFSKAFQNRFDLGDGWFKGSSHNIIRLFCDICSNPDKYVKLVLCLIKNSPIPSPSNNIKWFNHNDRDEDSYDNNEQISSIINFHNINNLNFIINKPKK